MAKLDPKKRNGCLSFSPGVVIVLLLSPACGARAASAERLLIAQDGSARVVIVQAARLTGGRRKIISVTEVQGMEGDVVVMQDIFRFEQDGVDAEGKAYGRIVSTGVRPLFMDRLISHGAKVDPELFQPRNLVVDYE